MDGIDISLLHGLRFVPGLNDRFWQRVHIEGECWIWQGRRDEFGYGIFSLPVISPRGATYKSEGVHRIVYEAVNGPIPNKVCVLHSCDHPPCLRPFHLRAGSKLDNARDKMARHRTPQTGGALARYARVAANMAASARRRDYRRLKLTDDQVLALRDTYAGDPSLTAAGLGRRYGISKQTAIQIIRGFSRKRSGGPFSEIRPGEGDRVPNAKLTDERVQAMRAMYARRGVTIYELADQFGVTPGVVSQTIRGKRWAHVLGPFKPTAKHRRLTKTEVLDIRRRHREDGVSQAKLAVEYGVSKATVCLLMNGKTHPEK